MSRSIYVIRSKPGPVKVGIAGAPRKRLSTLRTASAVPLFLDFAAETDGDIRALEQRVHALLAEKRVTGEWFKTKSSEAVAAVLQAAGELGVELHDARAPRPPKPRQRKSAAPAPEVKK